MQITHEQARRLIQFKADQALNPEQQIVLSAHLQDCAECRRYADEINDIETVLLPAMRRRWTLQPIPLSIDIIRGKRALQPHANPLLTTRRLAAAILSLALLLGAWQFTISGRQTLNPLPIHVFPVPTPSIQSTSTKIMLRNCNQTRYIVQKNDTLESIAYQFLTSKDEIITINNLQSETISPTMELVIPICNFTPTGTLHPTYFATTYTPPTELAPATPGG